jgi:hypothetical protein
VSTLERINNSGEAGNPKHADMQHSGTENTEDANLHQSGKGITEHANQQQPGRENPEMPTWKKAAGEMLKRRPARVSRMRPLRLARWPGAAGTGSSGESAGAAFEMPAPRPSLGHVHAGTGVAEGRNAPRPSLGHVHACMGVVEGRKE